MYLKHSEEIDEENLQLDFKIAVDKHECVAQISIEQAVLIVEKMLFGEHQLCEAAQLAMACAAYSLSADLNNMRRQLINEIFAVCCRRRAIVEKLSQPALEIYRRDLNGVK